MDELVTVNPYFVKVLESYHFPTEKITYILNFVSSTNFFQGALLDMKEGNSRSGFIFRRLETFDMMILPSYEELFPMTILEAMQCRIPILVRNLDIYEEILFDYVQYADSVGEFVECIQRLSSEVNFYRYCCECASLGASEYDEEQVAGLWRKYYREQVKK